MSYVFREGIAYHYTGWEICENFFLSKLKWLLLKKWPKLRVIFGPSCNKLFKIDPIFIEVLPFVTRSIFITSNRIPLGQFRGPTNRSQIAKILPFIPMFPGCSICDFSVPDIPGRGDISPIHIAFSKWPKKEIWSPSFIADFQNYRSIPGVLAVSINAGTNLLPKSKSTLYILQCIYPSRKFN